MDIQIYCAKTDFVESRGGGGIAMCKWLHKGHKIWFINIFSSHLYCSIGQCYIRFRGFDFFADSNTMSKSSKSCGFVYFSYTLNNSSKIYGMIVRCTCISSRDIIPFPLFYGINWLILSYTLSNRSTISGVWFDCMMYRCLSGKVSRP